MTYLIKAPPMPPQDVPFVDPQSGRINPLWWQWLQEFKLWLANGFAAIP